MKVKFLHPLGWTKTNTTYYPSDTPQDVDPDCAKFAVQNGYAVVAKKAEAKKKTDTSKKAEGK